MDVDRLNALGPIVHAHQLANENAELRRASAAAAAEQAAAAQVPAPPDQPPPGVDTRLLGRPDRFNGHEDSWRAWSVVMRAYAGAISTRLLFLIAESEQVQHEPSMGSRGGDRPRIVLAVLIRPHNAFPGPQRR